MAFNIQGGAHCCALEYGWTSLLCFCEDDGSIAIVGTRSLGGRSISKLTPHRSLTERFLARFWDTYSGGSSWLVSLMPLVLLPTSAAGGKKQTTGPAQAHGGSPIAGNASSTSQHEPGQIFGSFDRAYRKHVEFRLDQLLHAIQESRATLQASSAILAQEGGAALEAEADAE